MCTVCCVFSIYLIARRRHLRINVAVCVMLPCATVRVSLLPVNDQVTYLMRIIEF